MKERLKTITSAIVENTISSNLVLDLNEVEIDNNQLEFSTTLLINSLMPELEELVKKNPNRLIGCGG